MTNPIPRIDPEFKALIPPLSQEEYNQLEQNILAFKRCRDAIVVWDNTIVDGHNRFRICAEHGVPFEIKEIEFESRDEAKLWILQNQLGRRNLTDAMRIELAMSKTELLREQARKNQSQAGGDKSKMQTAAKPCPDWVCGPEEALLTEVSKTSEEPINVRKAVADEADVSEWLVHKYAQVLEHGSPQLIEAVKTGKLKIGTAHRLLDSEILKQLKQADKLYRLIKKDLPTLEDTPYIHEVRAELAKLQNLLETLIENANAYRQQADPERAPIPKEESYA